MSAGAARFGGQRRSKFGARKVVLDGIKFDSHREARRFQALRTEERLGIVQNIRLQVPYECRVNGKLICKYLADFVYERRDHEGNWSEVVEDAKGFPTPEFKLKKKLVEALHGVEILLT